VGGARVGVERQCAQQRSSRSCRCRSGWVSGCGWAEGGLGECGGSVWGVGAGACDCAVGNGVKQALAPPPPPSSPHTTTTGSAAQRMVELGVTDPLVHIARRCSLVVAEVEVGSPGVETERGRGSIAGLLLQKSR